MSDEKKKPDHPVESEKDVQGLPETNFLPPLKMVLAFIDQDDKEKNAKHDGSDERNVEKLIANVKRQLKCSTPAHWIGSSLQVGLEEMAGTDV